MENDFIKGARRTGLSDGFYGYPADPGDCTGAALAAYRAAYKEGRVKGLKVDREDRAYFRSAAAS